MRQGNFFYFYTAVLLNEVLYCYVAFRQVKSYESLRSPALHHPWLRRRGTNLDAGGLSAGTYWSSHQRCTDSLLLSFM